MHFARTFLIMRAKRVGVIVVEEFVNYMEKLYRLHRKHLKKWLVEACIPFILPPGSAPDHKLEKPSNESGIFQSVANYH